MITWDRIKSLLYALGSFLVALGLGDEALINEIIGGIIMTVSAIIDFFGWGGTVGEDTPSDQPA